MIEVAAVCFRVPDKSLLTDFLVVFARFAAEWIGEVAQTAHRCLDVSLASWKHRSWQWLTACSRCFCQPVLHFQFNSRCGWSPLAVCWFKSVWPRVGW